MAIENVLGIDLFKNYKSGTGQIQGQPLKEQSKPVNFGGLTTRVQSPSVQGFSEVVKTNPIFVAEANAEGNSYKTPMQNLYNGVGGDSTGREVEHKGKIGVLAENINLLG